MHNTYIYSLRSKGPLSFSFNDYSYFFNERFDRTPFQISSSSSSCCACACACCSCCTFSTHSHRVPTSPTFLYGLRQSTLLQCSASRRLILGSGNRYYNRLPVQHLDRGCYEVSCSLKETSVSNRRRRRRKNERCTCMVSEESENSDCFDDVEAVLSLLSEQVSDECLGGRVRSGFSFESVEEEKRGSYGNESYRGKKKNVESASQESYSRHNLEPVILESRDEDCCQNEESETFLRSDNRKGRKGGSSCSSYYSVLSSGDYESDMEVQENQGQFVEKLSSGCTDSGKSDKDISEGKMEVEYKRQKDDAEGQGGISEQRNAAVRNGVEWDWRKKSEKKLTEIMVEETQSRKESSQMNAQASSSHESDYGKSCSSHSQIKEEEENSKSAMNLDKGTRKQYGQIGNQVIGVSKSGRKYQELTELREFPASEVETTSSQKRSSVREGNIVIAANLLHETRDEHYKTVGLITGNDKLKKNSHQVTEMSEMQDVNTGRTSDWQRESDTRMKKQEENTTLVLSSAQQMEQPYQTGEWISEQIDSGRKSQRVTEMSEFHDSNIDKASIMQRETRLNNKKKNSDLVSILSPEAKQLCPKIDQKAPQRIQSRKGYEDVSVMSVVHASDIETVTDRRTSERRINQNSNLTSLATPVGETRERYNQTDEMVLQIISIKEAQRPTKPLAFHEETSEEASNFQASVNLVSQGQVQQIDVEEADNRSSQAMVMPPPSQLVSRGSLHVEMTGGNETQEASGEASERGSSDHYTRSGGIILALHHEPYGRDGSGECYGDALGSADRLEKSSTHYVGEFVENVRQEVLTSEIKKDKKDSEMKLVSGEKYGQKSSSQFGSGDSQLRERKSRHPSGGSGTKGPSVEIWDVTDSTIQKTPQTEGSEDTTTTGNAIMKRSGRSLWGIIADVIRLRWVSHSESPHSVTRSGRRSLSNKPASSETFFSGREHEENNRENAKKEKRSMPAEVMSSDQQLCSKTSLQSQGEASDTTRSKDKISYLEGDASSSLGTSESGSVSKGISLASGEENVNEDAKGFHGAPSGMEVAGPLIPSPTGGIRRSAVVDEISKASETAASEYVSMEQVEEPVSVRLIEISDTEGKDGELQQRKLQRNKQVPRDRFDEWEEAYKLESEQRRIDEIFMKEALLEAKKAADSWEVPVGAVLVQHGKIIARGCNLVEELRDSTAHAEMMCIREASNLLRTWRLSGTTLYVTLEPCPMCAGAILQARINTLVWGTPNKLLGADGSWIRLFRDGEEGGSGMELPDKPAAPVHPFHPKMTIRRGVLASDCADAMQQFFQLRRRNKEKKEDPPPPPASLPISHHPSKFLTKMHDIFQVFCL
ncbi:hypothetical protein ACB098_03G102300 [Castanea mollissima]